MKKEIEKIEKQIETKKKELEKNEKHLNNYKSKVEKNKKEITELENKLMRETLRYNNMTFEDFQALLGNKD